MHLVENALEVSGVSSCYHFFLLTNFKFEVQPHLESAIAACVSLIVVADPSLFPVDKNEYIANLFTEALSIMSLKVCFAQICSQNNFFSPTLAFCFIAFVVFFVALVFLCPMCNVYVENVALGMWFVRRHEQ